MQGASSQLKIKLVANALNPSETGAVCERGPSRTKVDDWLKGL